MADEVTWDAEAKAFLDAICSDLPYFIRSQARSATSEEAARQAQSGGGVSVSKHHVVVAMIRITPSHMKMQLRAMLERRGVDTSAYGEQFR